MVNWIVNTRQWTRQRVDWIKRIWTKVITKFPFILTIYHLISWIALLVFFISLIFIEDSRTILTQFLWSFYVILQFWLLARSKTLTWKTYITFFLIGAWIITPFTALFVNAIHFIFGGDANAFWSSSILTPIAEECFKLIPLFLFLFISRRASSLSLIDFLLIGGAVGAGFQFLEETARRLDAGMFWYGRTLFGQVLHWDVFTLFPGYFEEEFFATQITASHAVITALIALGIGIAIRLRSYIAQWAYIVPFTLFLLGAMDHAVWNGKGGMPEWITSFHDLLGSGYATKPLLLILLALAIIVDYWILNHQRKKLPRLDGEPIINPFTEIYRLIHSFCVQRHRFGHLLSFYRERRELGMIHQFGNKETQERKSHLREKIEDHYRPLLAFMAVLFFVTLAVTQMPLLHTTVDICFACLFDGLQSWWSELEWYEKGAIDLFTFALMFPLLGFWSGVGLATTVTATFASGDRIADIIRHPSQLRSPEFVISAAVGIGLSRIPGGRQVSKKVLKSDKGIDIKDITKLSVDDIPTAKSGNFNKFFNSLTSSELDEFWKDKKIRKKIERQLRAPGGLHEWHLVSRAPQFKYWNISAEEIKDLRTAISDVKFVNPNGVHGGLGSTKAHNELLAIIDTSNDYNSFVRRLNNWANYRLEGGISSLPEILRLK